MSRLFSIVNCILIIFSLCFIAPAAPLIEKAGKKPIVITSHTLTADNKNNTAIFEGSVIAKTDDITMYSDKMTVFYDNSESRVKKIHAVGNVKVHKKERAIFSNEATYLDDEGKIIFTGNPKAVEGENLITGSQIIFFLNEDRAVVEGSRVILLHKQGMK
jgi:lipopolysaccharide export system protein LptA